MLSLIRCTSFAFIENIAPVRHWPSSLTQQQSEPCDSTTAFMREYVRAFFHQIQTKNDPVNSSIFLQQYSTASLCLAVDTKQSEWREIGEHALNSLIPMLQFSRWNFANKVSLLQALLHYVDGEYADADLAYNASIQSAHQHRFFHEEVRKICAKL